MTNEEICAKRSEEVEFAREVAIKNRTAPATMESAAEEIERLRGLLRHYANWIEDIYGQMPTDKAPGPPTTLLKNMRSDAAGQ